MPFEVDVSFVRMARRKINVSQEEMAHALGVSRNTISNWENEKSIPPQGIIDKIHSLFGSIIEKRTSGREFCLVVSFSGFFKKAYGPSPRDQILFENYKTLEGALTRVYWLYMESPFKHAFVVDDNENVVASFKDLTQQIIDNTDKTYSIEIINNENINRNDPFGDGKPVIGMFVSSADDIIDLIKRAEIAKIELRIGTPEGIMSPEMFCKKYK